MAEKISGRWLLQSEHRRKVEADGLIGAINTLFRGSAVCHYKATAATGGGGFLTVVRPVLPNGVSGQEV